MKGVFIWEIIRMSNFKLTEVYCTGNGSHKKYSLRNIYINPLHVVCLREDVTLGRLLSEGRLIDGLDSRQSFTQVTLSRANIQENVVVVGSLDEINRKLNIDNREILRG